MLVSEVVLDGPLVELVSADHNKVEIFQLVLLKVLFDGVFELSDMPTVRVLPSIALN